MYSLGVIFFEMCYAFKTGMERNQVLGALRTPKVVFPDEWPPSRMPKQREIISLLMNHDPSMRPQATQLLSGPLVPTINMGEQFYDSVIAGELSTAEQQADHQKSPTHARRSTLH